MWVFLLQVCLFVATCQEDTRHIYSPSLCEILLVLLFSGSQQQGDVEMEDVVIAGIAGRLPESENLQEFWENLLNGVDMVTEDDRRWKPGECLLSPLLES